jgi:glycosyltransferase involved in cell wall biosynthesis
MISGGVLDGRKGVNLALDSVALAKEMGAKVSFIVTCIGPELAHLRNLASQLGLEREVHFQQSLSRSEYLQQLGSADVFFLPSLRDAGPTALVEAMMTGCVPLVVDCNGPGEHVVEGAGIKVQPGSPTAMAGRFARIIAEQKKIAALKDKFNTVTPIRKEDVC